MILSGILVRRRREGRVRERSIGGGKKWSKSSKLDRLFEMLTVVGIIVHLLVF